MFVIAIKGCLMVFQYWFNISFLNQSLVKLVKSGKRMQPAGVTSHWVCLKGYQDVGTSHN